MKVFDGSSCRLGNALFRYMASSLFCIVYNGTRTYDEKECEMYVSENVFKIWSDNVIQSHQIPIIDTSVCYKFDQFYQTNVYHLFKNELIHWVDQHLNDIVKCEPIQWYYDKQDNIFRIGDLFTELETTKHYDIVIHLRLEDYLKTTEKLIIHPTSFCEILDTIDTTKKICIVCPTPYKEIEKKYIHYLKSRYNLTVESNDIITDFKIMNNTKTLICSISTVGWVAGFLSKKLETVYFPKNRFSGWTNQTFSTILENTIYYDNMLCNEEDLITFFDTIIL